MTGQQFYTVGAFHDDGAAFNTSQGNYELATIPGGNKITRVEVRGIIAYSHGAFQTTDWLNMYFIMGIDWVVSGDGPLSLTNVTDQVQDQWFYLGAPKQGTFLDEVVWPQAGSTGAFTVNAQSFSIDVRPQLWAETDRDLWFSIAPFSSSAPGYRFFGTRRVTYASGRLAD